MVDDGQRCHHNLTRGVVEVGVRHQRAELENLPSPTMRSLHPRILRRKPPPQLQDGALQRTKGVSHVKGEPDALAQEELASEDLLAGGVGEFLRELDELVEVALGLAPEEQRRLEQVGGWVCHDRVGDVEPPQENRSRGADFGGHFAELGGADELDGEELDEPGLFVGSQEFGLGIGGEARRNLLLREGVRLGAKLMEAAWGEGPEPKLAGLAVPLVFVGHDDFDSGVSGYSTGREEVEDTRCSWLLVGGCPARQAIRDSFRQTRGHVTSPQCCALDAAAAFIMTITFRTNCTRDQQRIQ